MKWKYQYGIGFPDGIKLPSKTGTKRGMSKKYLSFLLQKQNYICALCKQPLFRKQANVDHIIPRSNGGSDNIDNLQATHKKCNTAKGSSINHFGEKK